jgi:hypothetical protein
MVGIHGQVAARVEKFIGMVIRGCPTLQTASQTAMPIKVLTPLTDG